MTVGAVLLSLMATAGSGPADAAIPVFDSFYFSSEDYRTFAMQQIAQEKRLVEELQLKAQ